MSYPSLIRALTLLLPLMCGTGSVRAASPLDRQPGVRHFDTRDGMMSAAVTGLAVDVRGNVWIGSPAGLMHYTGLQFLQTPLPDPRVTDVQRTRDFGIVVTCRTGAHGFEALRDGTYKRDAWTPFEKPYLRSHADSLKRTVFRISDRPDDGAVWFATETGGKLYTVFKWFAVDTSNGLPTDSVLAVASEPLAGGGSVSWLGTQRGLYAWRGEDSRVTQPPGLPPALRSGPVERLVRDSVRSVVWAGTPDGLYMRRGERWAPAYGPGAPRGSITALSYGERSDVWVGAGFRLYRLRRWHWDSWDVPYPVTAVAERDGIVWVGTRGGGVYRWEPGAEGGGTAAGWSAGLITAIEPSQQGGLFLAAGSEIWHMDSTGTVRQLLRSTQWREVNDAAALSNGSLWLATDSGVYRVNDGRVTLSLDAASMLRGLPAHTLALDMSGKLWIGAESGVFWIDPAAYRLTSFDRRDGNDLYPVGFTADSIRWMGTPHGVFAMWRGTVYPLSRVGDVPLGSVRTGAVDADGAFWFGDDLGTVVRVRGQRIPGRPDSLAFEATCFGPEQGIRGTVIRRITTGSDGALWIATNGGVHAVRNGIWAHYGADDGLVSIDVHAAIPLVPGLALLGTEAGLEVLQYDVASPDTRIEATPEQVARSGEIVLAVGGMDRWKETPTERLRYQWRVLDEESQFDTAGVAWSEARYDTWVALRDLAAGRYAVEVRAVDADANADPTPARAEFRVEPPIWRTWWIVVALVLCIGPFAWALRRKG